MAKPRVFDGTFFAIVALLAGLSLLAWWRGGGELVSRGFADGGGLLLRFGPVILVSFLAAGFAEMLIPQEWVRARLGAGSGIGGLLLATGVGILTPSGPFVSMPVAAVLIRSGAAAGPVVAFLAGWSLLALHRFVAWEVPLLGWRFALFRWAICLALPVLAGLFARLLTRG